MRIEDDEPHGPAAMRRHGSDRRISDAMVTAEHDGDRAGLLDFGDAPLEPCVALGRVAGHDIDISRVRCFDVGEDVEIPVEIVVAEEQRVLADLLRRSACRAAPIGCDAVIGHAEHDGVGLHLREVGQIGHRHERRHVAEHLWNVVRGEGHACLRADPRASAFQKRAALTMRSGSRPCAICYANRGCP